MEIEPVFEVIPIEQLVGAVVAVQFDDGTWAWMAVKILCGNTFKKLGSATKNHLCDNAEAHQFYSECNNRQ